MSVRLEASLEAGGERYRLVLEDYELTARWRLGGVLGGVLRLSPGAAEVDVREGVGGELLRLLRGDSRVREMMEAARLFSCLLGRPVVLRLHGRRVATLRCG